MCVVFSLEKVSEIVKKKKRKKEKLMNSEETKWRESPDHERGEPHKAS